MKKLFFCLFMFTFCLPLSVFAQEMDPLPVRILYQNQEIKNQIFVEEDTFFTIEGDETAIQVFIDQEQVSCLFENGIAQIPITPNDHQVKVLQEEQCIQEFTIFSPQKLEAKVSVQEGEYTLQPTFSIHFDGLCTDDVIARVKINDVIFQEISCKEKEEVNFTLESSGLVQVNLYYQEFPDQCILINEKDSLRFHFSNHTPVLDIQTKQDQKNGDMHMTFVLPDHLKRNVVKINDVVYEDRTYFDLQAIPGTIQNYHVMLEAEDLFGRKIQKEYDYKIDARKPYLSFFHGSQLLQPDHLYIFHTRENLNLNWDESVASNIEAFVNGQPIRFDDLNTLWQTLNHQDILILVLHGEDPSGNQNRYSFQMQYIERPAVQIMMEPVLLKPQKEPESKRVATLRSDLFTGSYFDSKETVRIWKEMPNRQIRLEKKEIKIQDQTKPIIRIVETQGSLLSHLKEGDKLRLTLVNTLPHSKDHFEKILINGEDIDVHDLKKDELQNEYVEFLVSKGETTIQAQAVDAYGNKTKFQETIKTESEENWWFFSGIPVVLVGLFLWLWLKYGNDQDS